MGTLSEKRENLRKEIAALLEKISRYRVMSALTENSKGELDQLLSELSALQAKIGGLQTLLALPDEKETVIAPFVPEPELPKQESKAPEILATPEIKIPELPKTEQAPANEKKLPDIHSFIGFNEKIMFMRNLFSNNATSYEEALNQVNTCVSYEEAAAIVAILQSKYAWNTGSEPVQIFIDTVKRRFA
jgi:hypothetical protein